MNSNSTTTILFFGDVVGQAGRRVVESFLSSSQCPAADLVIANIENCADGGFGLTESDVKHFFNLGIHVLTGGNHSFHCPDTRSFIGDYPTLLRPANYPEGTAGQGWCLAQAGGNTYAVINLLGRIHMEPLRSPFELANELVDAARKHTPLIIIDMHATATGEKAAMAHYLDGRASVVLGTHTHVQTADERILPGGTAFITDVGACAAMHSIIGMEFEAVFRNLLDRLPTPMTAASGLACASAILIEVDKPTGMALRIERISYRESLSDPDSQPACHTRTASIS